MVCSECTSSTGDADFLGTARSVQSGEYKWSQEIVDGGYLLNCSTSFIKSRSLKIHLVKMHEGKLVLQSDIFSIHTCKFPRHPSKIATAKSYIYLVSSIYTRSTTRHHIFSHFRPPDRQYPLKPSAFWPTSHQSDAQFEWFLGNSSNKNCVTVFLLGKLRFSPASNKAKIILLESLHMEMSHPCLGKTPS